MIQIFDSYRKIVDKLDEESQQLTVEDYQSTECFILSLYRSMLDYALAMDSSFRSKDYILLPVSLRAMAEAYGNMESLCQIEGFGSSYELRGVWQRELDIKSFIKFMDANPDSLQHLRTMYEDEKSNLEKLSPFVAKQEKAGVKKVTGMGLFSTVESQEIFHTAYRMSNSFLHNDMYGIERRNWKMISGKKAVVSARDTLSDIVLSCLYYSVKILSNSFKELEKVFDWAKYPKNLDSRIESFLVRMNAYADIS